MTLLSVWGHSFSFMFSRLFTLHLPLISKVVILSISSSSFMFYIYNTWQFKSSHWLELFINSLHCSFPYWKRLRECPLRQCCYCGAWRRSTTLAQNLSPTLIHCPRLLIRVSLLLWWTSLLVFGWVNFLSSFVPSCKDKK